jgi:hypothetical protein
MTYDEQARNQYFDESLATVREWVRGITAEINEGSSTEDERIMVDGLKAIMYYADRIAHEVSQFCDHYNVPVAEAGRLVLMLSGMGGFLVNGVGDIPAPMLLNIFAIVGEHLITDGTARTLLTDLIKDLGDQTND